MKTSFFVIFILLFLFFQRYGARSNMITTSSNVTCIQRDRESLLAFRHGLSNRLSTWTGVECCEWHGVGCDVRNGHVVKLDLRSPLSFIENGNTLDTSTWLKGKVSPSLLNLKHLRYLDLSMNNFSGQNIPEFFGSFKYLEYLNLSYSGFSGVVPPRLGNLSRLQYLDLNIQYRDDMVSLPYDVSLMVKDDVTWVSSLSSLKHLDLSGINIGNHIDWFNPVNMLPSLLTLNLARCQISYNIPSIKFINFTSLNSLDLSHNYITSTIPIWLSNLTSLVHLNLASNSFHGPIPDSMGTLTSLASIKLSSNRFNTSLPDSFWNLSSLVSLDLSDNAFHGWVIPTYVNKLCNLSILNLSRNKFVGDLTILTSSCLKNSLKVINLGRNNFSGIISNRIGEFTKLESLILSDNNLSGPIPSSLRSLSYLKVLFLDRNQLRGSIPESIGLLTNLQKLDLSSNQLSESIPESIGLLTRLEILDLSINQLNESIPESFGLLTRLKTLHLFSNQLSGVVSEIHFTKLKNLTFLTLSDNSLTLNISQHWIPPFQLLHFWARSCKMGPTFPNWLQTQTNLQWLDISNSSISGRLPKWFENISSHIYVLYLSYNQIGGKLPRLQRYNSSISSIVPRGLYMNSNKFEGSLTTFPTNVGVLDLSDNLLSGNVPYIDPTMNSGLSSVMLGKNRLSGSFPTHLCESHSISLLDLSHNNFSGILPNCLGSLIRMIVLDLRNNSLSGKVPNSLGSLSYLQSLHLNNNKFEGNLPTSLQNLTDLVTMDLGNNLLTGNIPFWIGKKLLKLQILNLQSNMFMGKIPQELCHIKVLLHLNLANNSITGNIPYCFYNLTGMIKSDDLNFQYKMGYEENILAYVKGSQREYTNTIRFLISLDLSNNNITGEIPNGLMNLVALNNLNLSRNLLNGMIPTTIGNLKRMESLDLSMNKLFGRIPPELARLNFLSHLNLSFNNLSGTIPGGNQLQTFNDHSIYEGNTGLCGFPLPSCKENKQSYPNGDDDEDKDGSRDLSWFYIGMIPGFVVGITGLIGSLHFIRIWRVTYFEMIENVYAWLIVWVLVTLARLRRNLF